ncbi:PIG-L deacetylase family protein [Catellatospora sichuanensis]|uniref:PIG-L deacetylase family protein n=1 Tax=Catellatospora sichuanensis TaxID=1969805 RepID=UPI001642946A|nr:PIG-L deacetylase family protein [Catellatospora sichuanensis]
MEFVSLLNTPPIRRIREFGALRLLRRLHRVTHRLPVQLRPVERKRILVVAPHMDDDVIGPGGTLALHRRLGSEISVVFCAGGASPEDDRTRKEESRQAAAYMGFERVEWLDFPTGAMALHEPGIGARLAELLRDIAPDQVFCPFVSDHHRDHTAAAMGVAEALTLTGWSGDVWCYEIWSPLWPNVAVDITDVVDVKRHAIDLYASQVKGLHYTDGALGLNRYRALRVYVPYAEAFYVANAAQFVKISRQMNTV